MEQLKEYIKNILGVEVKIDPMPKVKLSGLPLAYTESFKFFYATLFDIEVLFLYVREDFTTDKLRRQFEIIARAMNRRCIAVIDTVESYTRARLIEKKIQFIIPGKQMYLPEFLIDLKEFRNNAREIPATMQPSAQFLLLYHLQRESLEGINFSAIADKLFYNAMTVTRAAYFLHNIGLCEIRGTKEKYLHFKTSGKELWNIAEPYMSSPVKEKKYYTGQVYNKIFTGMCYANITALSHYTAVNGDVVDYFATKIGYVEKQLLGPNFKYSGRMEGNVCVEEWKYDPEMLQKDGNVDPLSLYLCFRDDKNERIEIALEQLIDNIKW